jgi:hypothetical protein
MNRLKYLKILNSNKNPNYRHGKYTISKCRICKLDISRQSRSHLCRNCWLKQNKNNYKFKCLKCNKNISYGAKLCQYHYIKTNSIFYKGKNNHQWKGGKTILSRIISSLKKYKIWRLKVFKRDNYTCQICKQIGGKLEVHHKIPISHIIDLYQLKTITQILKCKLLWLIINGITLCKKCHNQVHPEKGEINKGGTNE